MVCSFTGHRNIPPQHTRALINLVRRAIEYAYEAGCRTFCAGGALGFDTLVAREVINFRISHADARLVLLLPCIGQADGWSASARAAYEYTLKSADSVEYTSEEYTKDCMKVRNHRLAECCDMLVAYVSKYNSGAAQTVRFATGMNKKVFNLYPTVAEESQKNDM